VTLERIAAVALPPPAARIGALRPGPAAGDTLRLTLGPASADEVLATTSDRQPFRLAGLGAAAPQLTTGDVLLVRVLSTHPRLEFALLDVPGRGQPHDPTALPNAMRHDQLAQRRMSWRPPDAAAVAQSWRAMVLDRVASTRGRPGTTHSLEYVSRYYLGESSTVVQDGKATAWHGAAVHPDRWLFPAYVWGGLYVTLRLLDLDDEPPPPPPLPRRRHGPMALCLAVDIPALGPVAILVRLRGTGVQLLFFVDDERALQPLREAMPMVSKALSASGLRLVRYGVARGMPSAGAGTRLDERSGLAPAQLLPTPLFRAAAEVAVALSALLPPGGFSPVARPA